MAGKDTQEKTVKYANGVDLPELPQQEEPKQAETFFDDEGMDSILGTEFGELYSPWEGMICEGAYFLMGESKIGKSWLALELGYHVASGLPYMGRKTTKSKVLYLALEDSKRRLKSRLLIHGYPEVKDFRLATKIKKQYVEDVNYAIDGWLKQNGNNCLVIVDVFTKIKPSVKWSDGTAYQADYKIVGSLKEIAEKYHSAILLLHHPRKNKEGNDPFNWVNGSNGLMGASDGFIVMQRERMSDEIKFNVTGREFAEQEFTATKDDRWHFTAKTEEETRRDRYERNPIVKCLRHLIEVNPTGGKVEYDTLVTICRDSGMTVSDARHINRYLENFLEADLFLNDGITVITNVEMGNGSRKRGLAYYKTQK